MPGKCSSSTVTASANQPTSTPRKAIKPPYPQGEASKKASTSPDVAFSSSFSLAKLPTPPLIKANSHNKACRTR
eukprot:925730-Amphidinium_carterae.1